MKPNLLNAALVFIVMSSGCQTQQKPLILPNSIMGNCLFIAVRQAMRKRHPLEERGTGTVAALSGQETQELEVQKDENNLESTTAKLEAYGILLIKTI